MTDKQFSNIISSSAIMVMAIALLVLVGWVYSIPVLKSCFAGYITMKANTAILFLASGLALAFLNAEAKPAWRALSVALLSLFMMIFAGLTLAQYMSDLDLNLDEFFFNDPEGLSARFPPGRPAPITCVSFILVSLGFLLELVPRAWARAPAQWLGVLVFFFGFQALVGYAVGLTYVFGSAFYTQMAVHTAFAFALVSVGLLLSRPDAELVKVLRFATPAARIGRELLAVVVILPPLLRWLTLRGQILDYFDGDFALLIQVCAGAGILALVVLRSVSKLVSFEGERSLALQEMKNALRRRDEFISIASHELKTPITALKMQTQLFQRQFARDQQNALQPENVRRLAEVTTRQIDRLNELLDDMLDLTRVDGGMLKFEKQNCDIGEVVTREFESYAPQFKVAGVPVEFNIARDLNVFADRKRLAQVTANLLSNALKYGDNRPVKLSLEREGDCAKLTVADQGIGIAAGSVDRIFKRFERAIPGNHISGLGLGLYIARQIVDAHDGRIIVESEAGKGSTFSVLVPLASAP